MIHLDKMLSRIMGKWRRTLAKSFGRRMIAVRTSVPMISFTFDDAPRTAFKTGGNILKSHGARATFFISVGLLGLQTDVGVIASPDDLLHAVEEGHELGCHTFDHLDTWQTGTKKFVESVERNGKALDRILPGTNFRTFAYPISQPRPAVKSQLEKYFTCCRGGGQTPNVGMTDLNLLKACFLDKRTGVDMDKVKQWIDYNASRRGWLIFATHDVTNDPSPYGCTPRFFDQVVEYAARSGALILPVAKAFENLQTSCLG